MGHSSANGLGNYRDLLQAVTLSPTMGVYLSHYSNDKGDPVAGVFPDENYAREVMQLFSIGLFELNQDGSRKRNNKGESIRTYNNRDIRELARVFTGLANGCGDKQNFNVEVSAEFTCPMKVYEQYHDRDEKILLKGVVLTANQDGMRDIGDALDVLFEHQNTGPFFSRLLIQRLVKSNPTAEYISRVAGKFNDNGDGIRGDMKAVVTQILTDPEAQLRSDTGGKVRDPFLRFAHLYRALNLTSKSGNFYSAGWFLDNNLKQLPLRAPSVFNFYSPNHMPYGEAGEMGLYSPEMQIVSSFTAPMYYPKNLS